MTTDDSYKITKRLDGLPKHPKPRRAREAENKQAYKNTRLNCASPFAPICKYRFKLGTCALVRYNPYGILVTHSIEEINPEKDICYVSPPYVPLSATISVDAGSLLRNPLGTAMGRQFMKKKK